MIAYAADSVTYRAYNAENNTLVEQGATPSYDSAVPTKAPDEGHTYNFIGWDKDISAVTGDITYTAVFKQIANIYTLTINSNGNGTIRVFAENEDAPDDAQLTELANDAEIAYGTKVKLTAGDAETGYEFIGWYQPNGKHLIQQSQAVS